VCPILLDSDNIVTDDVADDKKRVIRALFIFLEYLIDDDQPEKEVKIILDYIHKQPGLMSNIILNLNQPQDDDA
jgi:hypothetical protein